MELWFSISKNLWFLNQYFPPQCMCIREGNSVWFMSVCKLTLLGLTESLRFSWDMAGMTTCILRGPLNPRTFVSCLKGDTHNHIYTLVYTVNQKCEAYIHSGLEPSLLWWWSSWVSTVVSCQGWFHCHRLWKMFLESWTCSEICMCLKNVCAWWFVYLGGGFVCGGLAGKGGGSGFFLLYLCS